MYMYIHTPNTHNYLEYVCVSRYLSIASNRNQSNEYKITLNKNKKLF